MNLYVLDRNLAAVAVIDTYTSLIWTDRYYEAGDFELCIPIGKDLLNYIKQDYYIWRQDSEHVMIIEKILIETDAEDGNKLTVTGRSLESILDRRVVWGQKTLNGNFQLGIKTLLNEAIIDPAKAERKIDNFIFEESDDQNITELTIESQYTGDNLYDVISGLCSERGVGFKITLNTQNQFVFKLYMGADRSYNQFQNPYVVFSPNFDNLISSSYLESRSSLKNVTLVGGEGEGSERRYTAVGDTSGLDRREMFTDARDISSDSDEDITLKFVFTQYASQVFDNSSKTFVTDANFNSCMVDVSEYVGSKVNISIPKYTKADGTTPSYATILVSASKQYISTLKVWETNGDAGGTTEEPKATGSLEEYEITIPTDAAYIYTSMFSQTAVDNDVYYGETDDFQCFVAQISSDRYVSLLRQRGKEDLAENVDIVSFEGEAETTTMFKYGTDFFVGDIVQVSDEYGHDTRARVLELVMSDNEDGSSTAYPTFSTYDYEVPETIVLPEGYTKLDYIYSSGVQYIDTLFKPNQDTRVVADVQFLSEDSYPIAIFGTRNSIDEAAFVLWGYDATRFRSDYGAVKNYLLLAPTGRHVIDKNKNATYVDETLVTHNTGTFQSTKNLLLFTQQDDEGVDDRMVSMRLYSCKVYDNGTLVRNFVPATDLEGIIGLYDIVNNVFYTNKGSSNFGSPTVSPGSLPSGYTKYNYIQSSGAQYIDTGIKPNQDTRVVCDTLFPKNNTASWLFGARETTTSNNFGFLTYQSYYRSDYNNGPGGQITDTVDRVIVDKNKNVTSFDNEVKDGLTYAEFQSPYNLYLFANNNAGTVGGQSTATIYSCQIYANGALVRDFVPCTNPSGTAGLYDLVNNAFYSNLGSGTFTVG